MLFILDAFSIINGVAVSIGDIAEELLCCPF